MRLATALAATALLAVPAAATAKGVDALAICGADACRAVDAATLQATSDDEFRSRAAPRPGPWYLLRARARVSDRRVAEVWTAEWLPRPGVMRTTAGPAEWIAPPARLRAALDRAARRLRARPPSALAPVGGATARVVETFSPADGGRASGPGAAAIAAVAGLASLVALGAAALAVRRHGAARRSR